ncbi:MAG TPA: hypothetical protein VNU68_34900 [Verrucomicrobiae bacterium]|nr:hypothetical protein [Verrucomicrobiae bacterium]
MSSTNSATMSLEERIVQRLKDDTLMSLIGDEDAMTELVRRAVKQALFDRRQIKEGYHTREIASPAVAAAESTAVAMCKTVMGELLADPKVKQTIRDAILDVLPQAMLTFLGNSMSSLLQMASENAVQRVRQLKQEGQL